MKTLFVTICIFLFTITSLMAQQSAVVFEYDSAGNRILRTMLVKKLSEAGSTQFPAEAHPHVGNQQNQEIKVYPNPTDGIVNIEFGLQLRQNGTYTLSAINGLLIMQGNLTSTINMLNMKDLAKGTYILLVETDEVKEKFKIVKQ